MQAILWYSFPRMLPTYALEPLYHHITRELVNNCQVRVACAMRATKLKGIGQNVFIELQVC